MEGEHGTDIGGGGGGGLNRGSPYPCGCLRRPKWGGAGGPGGRAGRQTRNVPPAGAPRGVRERNALLV
eukprot:289879-Pyramimonas_sp.AAC.2